MINLLPPDVKSQYHYARRNVVLRRWIVTIAIAFVGLGAIATYGLLAIQQSTNSYNKQIATTEALFKKEKYSEVEKQVEDISSSFKLVVKVLGQEVLFSKLLQQIAVAMPNNTVLTGLTINQTQGGIDIAASAPDYNTATQVQVNLADPANKIFSKADIVSVSCSKNSSNSRYPCTVNIRALFGSNNPFLFINSKQGAK